MDFASTARAVCAVALGMAIAAAIADSRELGFSRSVTPRLIAHYMGRFGPRTPERLEGWKGFVRGAQGRPEKARNPHGDLELLGLVNGFFNRIPSLTDLEHWRAAEYWATPAETVASNGGDCEDYAIGKYFALKELGIPVAQLRLVYAKTWWTRDAHMVLAYYSEPQADPLILDNLERQVRPASDRPDLIPVYSFNDDDLLFPQKDAPTLRLSASYNRNWRHVLEKLDRELAL